MSADCQAKQAASPFKPYTMNYSLKLYYAPGSCALASHILLTETGLPFEGIRAKIEDNLSADITAVNSKSRVPILIYDGEVVTETTAIMTLIASLVPDRKWLGSTPLETARVYEWCNYLSGTCHTRGYGGYNRPWRYVGDDKQMQRIVKERATEVIKGCYEHIEKTLSGVYAVGNSMTIVDPFLYVFWSWGVGFDMIKKDQYPKFQKLVTRLGELQSVRKVLEVEGEDSYLFE